MDQRVIIIGGPNGAGKSTFAREFLPNEADCPVFVDADLIAAGISPFNPEVAAWRAGRLMLQEIAEHVRRGETFAFETTLAGRTYSRLIPGWRTAGYKVHLVFLGLDTAELAVERVRVRVDQGGHNVPEQVIRRRFEQGWRNFVEVYRPLVDSWRLYDNSGELPQLLETGFNA
ncbi:MAG TPA: AAA family ATPase [Pyrinomonadaceae bacterium]|nr:AAA family ATPase [Pyrinomonadaceae bacterium]